MREQLHVIYDYHDQPRSGVADFEGRPHYFECQFDPAADEYSDIYLLIPVSESTFQPAIDSKAFDVWGFFVRTSSGPDDSSFDVEWTKVDAGAVKLSYREIESKSTLLEYCRQDPNSLLVKGDKGESGFYRCCHANSTIPFHIYIVTGFSKPTVLLVKAQEQVLIGHDSFVSVLDAKSAELKSTIDLVGPFYEFLMDEVRSQTLVIHQLGVVAISSAGQEQWRHYTGDIVTGWKMANGQLSLAKWKTDKQELLDLATGHLLP